MDKVQELLERICGDKFTNEWIHLNYNLIPITRINASIGNEEDFNELYRTLLNSDYQPMKRTPSGGICIAASYRGHHHFTYDIKQSNACCEMLVSSCFIDYDYEMRTYRIQFRINNIKNKEDNTESFKSGKQSDVEISRICKKYNVDLEKYTNTKEMGMMYKDEITKPDTNIYSGIPTRVYNNVCHLDFHKFYPSGIVDVYPEFREPFEELNRLSKTDSKYKTIMDAWTGFGRSKYSGYKYAKLIKDGINHSYEKFYQVMEALKKDREILFANTDGIWYVGDEWHGIYEGEGLGCWSNDHKNCTLRFKSSGSYEFIENGIYYPVVKGSTRLDKIKPREEWEWGDIFRITASIECWHFEEGVGIVWRKIN